MTYLIEETIKTASRLLKKHNINSHELDAEIKKSGSVFMLAFDDTDFSGGEVVSRIGAGYRYNGVFDRYEK